MTEVAKNVMLIIEELPRADRMKVRNIVNDLAELIEKHCGCKISIFFTGKENFNIEF